MTFAHPHMLLIGAVAACALMYLAYAAQQRRRYALAAYSNLQFLESAVRSPAWPARLLAVGWIFAAALVVVGAAQPRVRTFVPVHGGAVVLCIDTSGSMAAGDVAPTRANAALAALRAFEKQTPAGTAIGLVSFAGAAQGIVRPTRDRNAFDSALQQIPAPNGATAIGDALSLAQSMLPRTGHRVVVLITDGENNAGEDPLRVARSLAQHGIKLYTIGIGTNTGALIPGTLQTAGIDEAALRAYASATGGAYSGVADAAQLREALAALGRSTSYERATVDVSLAAALAGAALMGLTFAAGLAAGRFP
jgi:Ca-activated chloride channel family protein